MIRVRGLTKRFGGRPVLEGLDFSVEPGESIAIIGRSGVGKSVLVKHLVAYTAQRGRPNANGERATLLVWPDDTRQQSGIHITVLVVHVYMYVLTVYYMYLVYIHGY